MKVTDPNGGVGILQGPQELGASEEVGVQLSDQGGFIQELGYRGDICWGA